MVNRSGRKDSQLSVAEGDRGWGACVGGIRRQVNDALLELRAATGAEACELFLLEPGSGDMVQAAFNGISRRAFREITRFRAGQGFPGVMAEHGGPLFSAHLAEDGRFIRSKVKDAGFRSYLCVPVHTAEGVTGCIGIASRAGMEVSAVRPRMVQVAERLGFSIEMHRLRSRILMDDVVFDAQGDGKDNLDRTLSLVLRRLIGLSAADGGVVLLHDAATGTMRRAESYGGFQRVCRLVADGACLVACKVVGGRQCMAFLRREDGPAADCRPLLHEFAAVTCLPLRAEDHFYGVISLGYRTHRSAAAESLPLLPAATRQAVQLIRNALAILEVEQRAAVREGGRARAELGTFVLRSLDQVVTRLDAVAVLAVSSRAALRPELVSLQTMLRETLTAIESQLVHPQTTESDASPPPAADVEGYGFLDLRCLGRLTILRDGRPIPLSYFQRRRALLMLKVLLTNYGRPVSRDALIDILWPEAEPSKGAILLKVAAHYLRRGLEPDAPCGRASRFIMTVGDGYMFNPESPHRLDVKEFLDKFHLGERLSEQGDPRAALILWQNAAGLYAGDYMEEEIYSDWSMPQRERIRETFIKLARGVAHLLLQEGDVEGAIAYYRRALEVDGTHEALYRDLMRALWRLGRRDEALRQYRVCQEILARELGIRPLPETEILYRQIASGAACSSAS